MTKYLSIFFSSIAIITIATMGYFAFWTDGKSCGTTVVAGGQGSIGGAFDLVDHNGVSVSEKDIINGLTLIYFGYTYCPDICPLDTQRNLTTVDILDEQDIKITPVFKIGRAHV